MRHYRHMGITAALVAAASVGVSVRVPDEDLPRTPPPAPPKPVGKVHKHSREIARRLRQQARAQAKRAARETSNG